jgi:Flp pilus assembly protein CpaB
MIDAKRKAIIFLTLSFLLAVATAGVILMQITEAQKKLGKTVAVAAAAKNIGSYSEINESDITWVELPETSAYESFITDEQDLKDAISVVEIEEGDLLTSTLVRKKLDIPENERVVWLNATEAVLIDQEVAEGDLVDLVVARNDENDNFVTERFLNNIRVVQVEEVKEGAPRVKIALTIEEAERVIHFQNSAVQLRVLRVNQASAG